MFVGKAVILRWSVVAIIVLSAMTWGYFIITDSHVRHVSLPVYGNEKPDGSEHKVRNFRLVNQDGKVITDSDYEGKVYVADFFFTTCPGICPVMTGQLKRISDAYRNNDDVKILSHTVKPEEDSISVLKEYAGENNADSSQWNFVTGDISEINDLARNYYLLSEEAAHEDDFVHTQLFALVDTKKRVRGIYDGTDSVAVNKLIHDISILLKKVSN